MAGRELREVSSEIVRTVRLMDGRNRQRSAADGQLLGSWISASTVRGFPRPGTESEGGTPAGGEVRPTAGGAPGQVGRWIREPRPIVATVGGVACQGLWPGTMRL